MNVFFLLLVLPYAVWAIWSPSMENYGLYGGDMMMSQAEIKTLVNGASFYGLSLLQRWPHSRIPYFVDKSIGSKGRNAIKEAIAVFHNYTCITWVDRVQQSKPHVLFYKGKGCHSHVGYREKINEISLGEGCDVKGIVLHEMGHTIGLFHEHVRPDRDQYIEIVRKNVKPSTPPSIFRLEQYIYSFGSPYDLRSIMHYGSKAYGIHSNYTTIKTRDPLKQYLLETGQVEEFSELDIEQINMMYYCPPVVINSHQPQNCRDVDNQCIRMAKLGFCTTTNTFQRNAETKRCCHSCKERCTDQHILCKEWAQRNPSECQVNPNYMLVNCRKACNVCS